MAANSDRFSEDDRYSTDLFSKGHQPVELREQISIYEVVPGKRGDPSGLAPRTVPSSGFCGRIFPAGGLFASGVNLVKITLGTGTIGIPFALQQGGGILFTFFLLLACIGTVYSMYLLVYAFELTAMDTYELLGTHLVGRWMGITVSVLMILFCEGATIMYIIAMGSIIVPLQKLEGMPSIFVGAWGLRLLVTLCWFIFMFPLCLPVQINTLRYSSLVGVIATGILVIGIAINAGMDKNTRISNIPVFKIDLGLAISIATCCFSFGAQTNVFEIYAELKPQVRTARNLAKTTAYSMGFCVIIYLVCGFSGVANFGSLVESNILDNYTLKDDMFLVVPFVAIAVTLLFSFPVQTFPSRDTILQFIGYPNVYTTPGYMRIFVAGTLALISLVVGLFVTSISYLFGLVGSICASSICFIFPALFIIRTGQWTVENVGWAHVIATWTMLILGSLAGIFGTIITVYQIATGAF